MSARRAADDEPTREDRVDRYVRTYSLRTLAEMLVDLEDAYAPYARRALADKMRKRQVRPASRKG